ncbi:lysozyme inhibitor LprI family protein [Paracoccus aestuariivivens]|uniref:DUF1311 domain-containing protein n=1 Tax=Paracoccus aestuariivivens TaxID=1820333 RepID=A0A6L6JHD4_9RHOB|nr:lysozyme inhibitor LprI family protein [Paracoccus aestuariivivens]MTH79947.1 DUF1311 domain-containing protein [Paracoccus aestuariivivens]
MKSRVMMIALTTLTTALPLVADAQSPTVCADAIDQFTLNACAEQDYRTADRRLNEIYGKVSARLADIPDSKAALVRAQRAWIAFRDADCDFRASSVVEGSVYPMIHSSCLAELTEARSTALQSLLNCEEGDLSCPAPFD